MRGGHLPIQSSVEMRSRKGIIDSPCNSPSFGENRDMKRAPSTRRIFKRGLQRLAPQEMIKFWHIFVERKFAAYSWDLWLVVWLCQGGWCSDDGFHDFRAWLISRCRAIYEAAL